MDRRSLITNGSAAAFGAFALSAFTNGIGPAEATEAYHGGRPWVPMPDPATTFVPSPPFPKGLTNEERRHLQTSDTADFEVFNHADWPRLAESHAPHIRVHWPDGHYTDGLEKHTEDMIALFEWAPDTSINTHYIRVATNDVSAFAGVMQGTFTRPMPDGKGGFIKPTGKKYSINMVTIALWNKRGTMDEEFLYWDNQTFFRQIGIA